MSWDEKIAFVLIAILLAGAFLFFSFMNYSIIYRSRVKHENTPSIGPFIGGISGALFVLLLAGVKYPLLVVLPLIVDPGSVPLVVEFFVLLLKDGKKK